MSSLDHHGVGLVQGINKNIKQDTYNLIFNYWYSTTGFGCIKD